MSLLPLQWCISRTILEQYLKLAVDLADPRKSIDKKCIQRQCQTHFHRVHYFDALLRSYEERLISNEWQAALRLRKHKVPVVWVHSDWWWWYYAIPFYMLVEICADKGAWSTYQTTKNFNKGKYHLLMPFFLVYCHSLPSCGR